MHQSLFGEDYDFDQAFQQLTSEPPDDASCRFKLPEEELDQLREMAHQMADDGQSWERVVYECVRDSYVDEG